MPCPSSTVRHRGRAQHYARKLVNGSILVPVGGITAMSSLATMVRVWALLHVLDLRAHRDTHPRAGGRRAASHAVR
jgi:hypothetical protein